MTETKKAFVPTPVTPSTTMDAAPVLQMDVSALDELHFDDVDLEMFGSDIVDGLGLEIIDQYDHSEAKETLIGTPPTSSSSSGASFEYLSEGTMKQVAAVSTSSSSEMDIDQKRTTMPQNIISGEVASDSINKFSALGQEPPANEVYVREMASYSGVVSDLEDLSHSSGSETQDFDDNSSDSSANNGVKLNQCSALARNFSSASLSGIDEATQFSVHEEFLKAQMQIAFQNLQKSMQRSDQSRKELFEFTQARARFQNKASEETSKQSPEGSKAAESSSPIIVNNSTSKALPQKPKKRPTKSSKAKGKAPAVKANSSSKKVKKTISKKNTTGSLTKKKAVKNLSNKDDQLLSKPQVFAPQMTQTQTVLQATKPGPLNPILPLPNHSLAKDGSR